MLKITKSYLQNKLNFYTFLHFRKSLKIPKSLKRVKSSNLGTKSSREHWSPLSTSIASHEVKAKLKIACVDSKSNFAVFTKSELAVIETKDI